jgi:outer membrane protein assembly factor BamE (lipoprotein component of BamABCDE complex)
MRLFSLVSVPSRRIAPLFAVMLLTACAANVEHRGYLAKPGTFNQIRTGMGKSEVEGILGSPSTTASVNYEGDSYYYISSLTKQNSFLGESEMNREIIAIRFNPNDQVASMGQYGLEDGKVIPINSRTTPIRGRELTILQQILGNIGRPGPGGTVTPGRDSSNKGGPF